MSVGKLYKSAELIEKLSLYKEIAWNSKELPKQKMKYFMLLLNNAKMWGRGGEAIYYAEKADKAAERAGENKSLIALGQKIYFFNENGNYKKVIEIYEAELNYINKFPTLYKNNLLSIDDAVNSILLFNSIVVAYLHTGDTAKCNKTIVLAEKMKTEITRKDTLISSNELIISALLLGMYYLEALNGKHDMHAAEVYLNKITELIRKEEYQQWPEYVQLFEINLAEWMLEFFIKSGKNDSARVQLEKYIELGELSTDQSFKIELAKAEILSNEYKYKEAYQTVLNAIKFKNEAYVILTDEMDKLLYAFTDAEFNKVQLRQSEMEKQRRSIIIMVILILALVSVYSLYITMKKRQKKIQNQISQIDHIANLKIALLEESKHQAVKEEQERMAQELHDNLSARIMSVKHNVKNLRTDILDDPLGKRLKDIELQLQEIYSNARNQSHQWFYDNLYHQEKSFIDSIKLLFDSTLSDNQYKNEIDIEQKAVTFINYDQRINVIRIIQEALTNIIKHAKATEVSLFIFSKESDFVLQISDNGIGKTSQNIGFGLNSIQSRVEKMGGHLEVSVEDGFILTVFIPEAVII
ncbi:MAG TPA: ATP-binding protein [Chitinophagales bacterium]|nr:ATP-binding protein [Chitinophagales bacterium]